MRHRLPLLAVLAALLVTTICVAPASAKLGSNPSDAALAGEFLRILKAEDPKALDAFLSPAFILQRPDGTWLTKARYLKQPAVVTAYKVTDVHGRRTGDVRVIRYTAQTDQRIDGKLVTGEPVPRLSTYVRTKGRWQLVSHANFTPIPKR